MADLLRLTGALERFLAPEPRSPGRRVLLALGLALVYLGAAKVPFPSGLPFQAYLFWPAAAVAHTAYFILGRDAWLGLALGTLTLNLTGWLPWPYALAMAFLQTLEPWVAWRLLIRLGVPAPDLRSVRDLLRWLGVASATAALFSALLGARVVALASGSGFLNPSATSFSWFLGDLAALLCLGPALLLLQTPSAETSPPAAPLRRLAHPIAEGLVLSGICLVLLFAAGIHPGLAPNLELALQFALVLPALWLALRFGPRITAVGVLLLSLSILAQLWSRGETLPQEAFRFSQLYLIVLALAALVTSAATEEARTTRLELQTRELQGQRMEAVATLAGGLVHGFNNQLTVLLGNLDRLREQPHPSAEARPILDRLDAVVQGMEQTVHQLKALSHQAPLHAFSLPLAEALAPFFQQLSLPEGVSLQVELGDPCLVGLDPELLRQALQLLLANSLEAIPGTGTVRLVARCDDRWVHLVLEDDGPGMAPEVLQRAFDPFFTTRAVGRNRGLGLPIAFSLARQMGGWLTLSSRPGLGTRAELGLPLGTEVDTPLPPAPVPLRLRRVLLADDEAGIRELTREVLEGEGFSVVEAPDGQAAVEAFEANPQGFDLAILDLVMPRLHGADVLERLQKLRPELPVLLISGYSAELRPGLLDHSHHRLLPKPFRIRELLEALAALGLTPLPPAPPT